MWRIWHPGVDRLWDFLKQSSLKWYYTLTIPYSIYFRIIVYKYVYILYACIYYYVLCMYVCLYVCLSVCLSVCMYVCTYEWMNEYYESDVINTFLNHLKQFCLHMNTRVSHWTTWCSAPFLQWPIRHANMKVQESTSAETCLTNSTRPVWG